MGIEMKQAARLIPEDTTLAAHKAMRFENVYVRIGDRLGDLLPEIQLVLLDPSASGKPESVLRLALATAFQYAELLADPTASEASLRRIDWKYALFLPMNHPGLSALSLCNFRRNLFASPRALGTFAVLMDRLNTLGLFENPPGVPSNPLEALNTVCNLSRLDRVNRSMRLALSMLGSTDPEWLSANMRPHWYDRFKTGRLRPNAADYHPEEDAARLGTDIHYLLNTLRDQNRTDLLEQDEIRALVRIWEEQFYLDGEKVHWRMPGCTHCACAFPEEHVL